MLTVELLSNATCTSGVLMLFCPLACSQLDENMTTEALEHCIAYFNTIYPVLLGGETKMNQTHLLGDIGRALSSACDSIRTDAIVIRTLIQV